MSEVTYDVPNYFKVFNVFGCRRNILERLDVSYKRAYMSTPKEEEFTDMLYHIDNYDERQGH